MDLITALLREGLFSERVVAREDAGGQVADGVPRIDSQLPQNVSPSSSVNQSEAPSTKDPFGSKQPAASATDATNPDSDKSDQGKPEDAKKLLVEACYHGACALHNMMGGLLGGGDDLDAQYGAGKAEALTGLRHSMTEIRKGLEDLWSMAQGQDGQGKEADKAPEKPEAAPAQAPMQSQTPTPPQAVQPQQQQTQGMSR